jgi:hypothetical protein
LELTRSRRYRPDLVRAVEGESKAILRTLPGC